MDSCVANDPQNPSGVLHLPDPLGEVPPESNLDGSEAPDKICTKDAAHVKQLDPADAYGQRRTQIDKRCYGPCGYWNQVLYWEQMLLLELWNGGMCSGAAAVWSQTIIQDWMQLWLNFEELDRVLLHLAVEGVGDDVGLSLFVVPIENHVQTSCWTPGDKEPSQSNRFLPGLEPGSNKSNGVSPEAGADIMHKSELLRAPGSVSLQETIAGTLKASWSSVVKQGLPGGNPGSDPLIPGMLDGSPPLKFYHPDKIEDGVASITPLIDVLTQGECNTSTKSSKVELCSKKLEDLLPAPSIGDAPIGKSKVGSAMESSFSPAVGDGQLGDIDLLQHAAENLYDSNLMPPSLKPANENYELEPDASSFMPLDKAPIVKVLRFAPEILSVEAPSSASHSRKMAPCSDICHPFVFRKSIRGQKVSVEAPMDAAPKLASSPIAPPGDAHGEVAVKALSSSDVVHDAPAVEVVLTNNGSSIHREEVDLDCWPLVDSQAPLEDAESSIDVVPNPGTKIEDHDSLVPSSKGEISELAPASPVDLDHTPSSITRLYSKYSQDVSNIEGLVTTSPFGSQDRAQKKSRRKKKSASSKTKLPCGWFGRPISILAYGRFRISCLLLSHSPPLSLCSSLTRLFGYSMARFGGAVISISC
ncbi:hypothetical protein Nepgr_031295 [Nepenthes gracilis]|uniref:Uncharacterized protein n=1 Tax=Nepenthes gracilis TaxID=150966 RepID=A0AAD3TH99_NEPGR|nr:hypothetical protein Nepgr_031295 [Nepenthes gracilis]